MLDLVLGIVFVVTLNLLLVSILLNIILRNISLKTEAATGGVLSEKVFLEFVKFTGKNMRQSIFFNKVAG